MFTVLLEMVDRLAISTFVIELKQWFMHTESLTPVSYSSTSAREQQDDYVI
ncbi:MAG: hypothetical protein WBP54_11970 [Pelodictyon phaeoclathratiforme]